MKTHIFLQARMRSTRLPAKTMKKICGKTVLELIIERLRRVKNIDDIILVTGHEDVNKELIDAAKKINIQHFCGSDENILDRIFHASMKFGSEIIIRVTGDCPLIDFNVISKGLEIFSKVNPDILSVDNKRTYPDGFDFEIFTNKALRNSWEDNKKNFSSDKEFEASFISPAKYMLESKKFTNFDLIDKVNNSSLSLTLDYPEDLEFIKMIYEELYPRKKDFSYRDILSLLKDKPHFWEINQKQDYQKINFNLD